MDDLPPTNHVDQETLPRKSDSIDHSEIVSPTLKEETSLCRIFDIFLLPPLALMYLFNALDKGNVGNAKTDGWDKDIHLSGNQVSLNGTVTSIKILIRRTVRAVLSPCYDFLCSILLVMFDTYFPVISLAEKKKSIRFGTPISLLVKKFSAARVLPLMMMGYGSMSIFAAIAKNFSQIFAIRFFLGIFEAPMLPGVVFYLSTFYKRNELASRVGLFYAAASISGAFSGLIAYGIFHLHNPKYHSWQFLFWIEGTFPNSLFKIITSPDGYIGAGTICFAIFAWFWLPLSPSTWTRLDGRQKAVARSRILADSSVVVDERLDIRDAFRPFEDPMYWLWAMISLSFGVPLASVNNFLPQIVASLGYSTVRTNLLTVAPNIVGTVALLLLTFSSDYFRERSFHICIALATALTGFIILGCIDVLKHRHVAYFACFLLTSGAFAPSVLVSAWYSNNTPSESRRAVVAAVMVAIANSSGLISTNVFRAQDEPKYIPALATSAVFGGLCLLLVASTGIYMRIENRRRNKDQGVNITAADVDTKVLGDGPRSPSFRYMY